MSGLKIIITFHSNLYSLEGFAKFQDCKEVRALLRALATRAPQVEDEDDDGAVESPLQQVKRLLAICDTSKLDVPPCLEVHFHFITKLYF